MAVSERAFIKLCPSNPIAGGDGCREGATASPSTRLLGFLGDVWEGCGKLRLGLLSALHGPGLPEDRKPWQVKVHGRVFMRWLLHGEGLQSPSLLEGLEEGEHSWEGPSSANGLCRRSGLLWPRLSRSLKLTLVVLQTSPGQELVLHCIQHTLWSSQLEHAVLENCMC